MNHYEEPVGLGAAHRRIAIFVAGMIRVMNGTRPDISKYRGGLAETDAMLPLIENGFGGRPFKKNSVTLTHLV